MASLKEYKRKRNFAITTEPEGRVEKSKRKQPRFVIQKHDATRLHYDFRLEMGGTLISWAVPKGLPMVKGEKHLAVKVEDHPISYIDFEGTIPQGQYGGGTVQVWDRGTYEPLSKTPKKELDGGKLHVMLKGKKLNGEWYLVRLKSEENQWLIIKGGEDHKNLSKKVHAQSALSGKTMAQLAKSDHVWQSKARGPHSGNGHGSLKERLAEARESVRTPRKVARANSTSKTPKKKPALKAKFLEPMKARIEDKVPPGDWIYEIKFDGFRAVTYKKGKAVHLLSRTNHDLAAKFPDVVEAMEGIDAQNAIVDGEIVALDKAGRSSFQLLQAYELGQERPPLCYYVFDILALNGKSTRDLPLEERREKLKAILPEFSDIIRFSASIGTEAEKLLKKAGALGLEGLIGKRKGSRYEVGQRSGAWIKLKIVREQEFVIGGYTPPGGTRQHIGALLVGVYQKGKLVYSGKVGTGYTGAVLKDLHARFKKVTAKTCPFTDLPEEREGRYGQGITASVMKKCHWVKPVLVCQVKFSEWTRDNRLRQPVYLGLREDKKAKDVIRESASKLS
ncbi:bifunctional non-homologous end joining protein LigD [Roseimicrobium gellanilyticum]|uniref:DNA ligase (ATP) n=1 Tax=Roseimicrobium gellanilyticum TaxID=748857 RepID=A0A366HIF1_9BACT|nr:non-homologous end-joining DNA ligase [Roseimicrobium gellanilyticum]RBP41379.1 bifunctional non-homologous end joining protein LigD [Roseimicrobium gellanilyticum]